LGRPNWNEIFARDQEGVLRDHLNTIVDGEWQRPHHGFGETVRQRLFLRAIRACSSWSVTLSDEQVGALRRRRTQQ